MKLTVATNNEHKLVELRRILEKYNIEPISLKQAGIDIEIEETGKTFFENAKIKALSIYDITKTPVIADDSGLCVDYLNDAPSIYSARYCDGSDMDRNMKVLSELEGVPKEQRTAHFVCSICLVIDYDRIYEFTGECYGYIDTKVTNGNGFGYDSIFINKDGKSFAKLTSDEKDSISHRGNALRKFKERIEELL